LEAFHLPKSNKDDVEAGDIDWHPGPRKSVISSKVKSIVQLSRGQFYQPKGPTLPGVNFINININNGKKCGHKMLVKLTFECNKVIKDDY
jgi:hypothetical protein